MCPINFGDRINLPGINQKFAGLSVEYRIRTGLEMFPEIVNGWKKDHPEWRMEVLLWILDWALHSLRRCIESPTESEISWESPYVELHFPVECTWEKGVPDNPSFSLMAGRLSKKDMADDESAIQSMAKLLVRYLEITALQDFTNERVLEKHGDGFKRCVDAASIEELENIASREEQERALQKLFQPLSFGAGHIDFGEMKEDDFIGKDAEAQLAAILPPLIHVPFEANGRKMRVITILEVNPLIADPSTRTAYFPIVVGLAVQFVDCPTDNEDMLSVLDSVALSNWPEMERNRLWEALTNLTKAALNDLDPDPKDEMIEAVLSVNAQIKCMVPTDGRRRAQHAMSEMLQVLGTKGEILNLSLHLDGCKLLDTVDQRRLHGLFNAVEGAETPHDKGRALENLVADLFSSIPDFDVVERVRTESEEIDIWISNRSDQRPFRNESDVILAECKNWSGKCGKNEFVQLYHKVLNRGGRCSIGFLISWNGFAETITTEMLRASREAPLIVPIDRKAIKEAVESGNFLDIISTARQKALMV